MRQHHAEWEGAFGFGPWYTDAVAETGELIYAGFELNVLTGQFNTEQVKQKLLSLGYETRTYLGQEYLAVPEGERPSLDSPLRHFVNPNVRNVFTDGTILLTAPGTAGMEELLAVRAGEALSLGRHPAFGDLTATLPDPFYVSILSRKAVLEPEHPPFREYEPRPDWGGMGSWEVTVSRLHPSLARNQKDNRFPVVPGTARRSGGSRGTGTQVQVLQPSAAQPNGLTPGQVPGVLEDRGDGVTRGSGGDRDLPVRSRCFFGRSGLPVVEHFG